MGRLDNKVAIITGGCGGIGQAAAAKFISAAIRTDELHRLITATVIDAAGSGGAFRTEIAIAADAEIVVTDEETGAAELQGDVWLIGAGDPGLATADYAARFDNGRVFTDFDQLAADAIAELQARNIVTIRGRVIGDESKYTPVEADYFYNIDVPDGEGGTTREPVWVAGHGRRRCRHTIVRLRRDRDRAHVQRGGTL